MSSKILSTFLRQVRAEIVPPALVFCCMTFFSLEHHFETSPITCESKNPASFERALEIEQFEFASSRLFEQSPNSNFITSCDPCLNCVDAPSIQICPTTVQ